MWKHDVGDHHNVKKTLKTSRQLFYQHSYQFLQDRDQLCAISMEGGTTPWHFHRFLQLTNHTVQISLGCTGTAAEMLGLKWRAGGEYCNFHTKQSSLPGPKIKAPPCWAGSPWKSKAGPVIALHILLMLPRSVFDFTWGLRTEPKGKIFVI